VVDVEPWLDRIRELAGFYRSEIGFGDPGWLDARLRGAGADDGVGWAEALDAWETKPGVVDALLPAAPAGQHHHPSRVGTVGGRDG
jgi:hypothetical protein